MTKLRQGYQDVHRLRVIVSTLFDAGFSSYVDAARFRYMVSLRTRLRLPFMTRSERERLERPIPVRVREAFERLGPTFVKFGQMLSLRSDLVGEEYAAELVKLQEHAPRIPFPEVERLIETELGRPLEKIFVRFDKTPLAAASLAEVHRAELSGKRQVAVKVQRPGIRKTIEHDIHLMLLLAHLLERSVPTLARYRPVSVVKEFADWTMRELDFSVEGASIDRFRANFSDVPEVVIPTVHWTQTRPLVLTVDYVDGRSLKTLATSHAKSDQAERLEVARILLRTLLKMYFLDGFFQADPHPGNFRVLPGPRLVMFDFGMVGYLTGEIKTELISCFMSYVNRDMESYTRHLLELANRGPEADVSGFRRDVQGLIERFMFRPTRQKASIATFAKALEIGAGYDIHFPSDLVLFGRSIAVAEATALALSKDVDLDALVRPVLDQVVRDQLDPRRIARTVSANSFDYLAFVKELPERTIALLRKAETGEFGVRLNLEELKDIKDEFDRQNDVRVVAIVAAALFVGAGLLLQIRTEPILWGVPIGQLSLLTSFALFLWTAFQVMHRPRG